MRSAAALLVVAALPLAAQDAGDRPTESGLVERVTRNLAQVHMTLTGPEDAIAGITAADLEVAVGGRVIDRFTLDPLLVELPFGEAGVAQTGEAIALAKPSYLFYFDQPMLTFDGRIRAIEVARALVERLVMDGARGTVVDHGSALTVMAGPTEDAAELLAALDELARRPEEIDTYAALEDRRIEELLASVRELGQNALLRRDLLNDAGRYTGDRGQAGIGRGASDAFGPRSSPGPLPDSGTDGTTFQTAQERERRDAQNLIGIVQKEAENLEREERSRSRASLERLRSALYWLADELPPKSLVYFGDILRQNPGEHYLRHVDFASLQMPAYYSEPIAYFDQVIDEAAALGVRLFTVKARGLTSASGRAGDDHIDDVHDALKGLALETGGEAFLNNISGADMAGVILDGQSRGFLISFDPEGLPVDTPLQVSLRLGRKVKGVRLQAQGRLVLHSPERRLTSRMLATMVRGRTDPTVPLQTALIPVGYEKGRFQALAQVAILGSTIPRTTWDIGASAVIGDRVTQTSGRIAVDRADIPVVFQERMEFPPGAFELTGMAYEVASEQMASRRFEGVWPDPKEPTGGIGPVAVIQPVAGAIVQDRQPKKKGAVAFSESDRLRADRPTMMLFTVCRGRKDPKELTVNRALVGDSPVEFPDRELGEETCALMQDLIPAETLGDGGFRYRVQLVGPDGVVAESERLFRVGAAALLDSSGDGEPTEGSDQPLPAAARR